METKIETFILALCLGICIGALTVWLSRFDIELQKDGSVIVESKTATKIIKDLDQLETYIQKDNI